MSFRLCFKNYPSCFEKLSHCAPCPCLLLYILLLCVDPLMTHTSLLFCVSSVCGRSLDLALVLSHRKGDGASRIGLEFLDCLLLSSSMVSKESAPIIKLQSSIPRQVKQPSLIFHFDFCSRLTSLIDFGSLMERPRQIQTDK